jgi:hypothetical protein
MVAFFTPVPSNTAVSPAPGTIAGSQLAASDQLFVRPSPIQVRVAA